MFINNNNLLLLDNMQNNQQLLDKLLINQHLLDHNNNIQYYIDLNHLFQLEIFHLKEMFTNKLMLLTQINKKYLDLKFKFNINSHKIIQLELTILHLETKLDKLKTMLSKQINQLT